MNDRDINHLHPDLQPLCRKWLAQCHEQVIDSFVIYTWRSPAEQDALYAQGRTAPGKIITNAKGGQSKHNFTLPDGTPASKAFDFAIRRKDGTLNWSVGSSEWKAAVAIGKALGLIWGGDFRSIIDSDHFELP
ncbi:M15 family metallopeptidase [Limnoglobus roseus]|uniref:Peptidoglycan L-alanyl-D-glutamate endopeptidase CwlK n=1 Tax=Limnoglobus roseus TaxID=2598579 RepID=A0A5C1ACG8_9BACT|nr:M15 family metallopeptidase [Limnoglobus roseus]QEL14804.1 Peptidoglycan L-alanyl-D-glutamate endopeptidase CwlK [Limnoglobus roseus]